MGKGVIAGAVSLLLVVLVFFVLHKDATLYDALPPRFQTTGAVDARLAAQAYADQNGGRLGRILGTGSMSYKNYIPAAPEDADPYRTIVAYYVLDDSIPFSEIRAGDLCAYVVVGRTNWILHQAADYTDGGWIMAGNANGAYDGLSNRMTADTYRGKAIAVFVVPQ